jgi:prepilin-type N-terminal cleavage/methylation domain-containing protein
VRLEQFKNMYTKNKGFTLIELMISISIIAVLSAIVMFSVTQYVNKGKDSNVSGNLAVLVPAGEVYYDIENTNNGDGYNGFCLSGSAVNAFKQISIPTELVDCSNDPNHPGICCNVEPSNQNAWAACAQEFTNNNKAYCVDSRGIKNEICNSHCTSFIYQCPNEADLSSCS